MRRREWWHVALMHCVTAVEMHAVRHFRRIEMRALRAAIFPHVDVRHNDVACAVDVITELAREMVFVFRDYGIVTGRRGKTFLAARNGRLSDKAFAFIKVRLLLRK